MVDIPAFCENGHIFLGGGLNIGPVRTLRLGQNFTRCPLCRSRARFIEGLFEVRGNQLVIRGGPTVSFEILRLLEPALKKAVETNDVETLENEAESLDKALGDVVRACLRLYPRMTIAVGILALMLACAGRPITFDVNQLIEFLMTQSESRDSKQDETRQDSGSTSDSSSEKKTDLERHD